MFGSTQVQQFDFVRDTTPGLCCFVDGKPI